MGTQLRIFMTARQLAIATNYTCLSKSKIMLYESIFGAWLLLSKLLFFLSSAATALNWFILVSSGLIFKFMTFPKQTAH